MNLEDLRLGVERVHGGRATFLRIELVEEFVWRGEVAVFALEGGPAPRAYAWPGETGGVAVLELGPVVDARTAVQASLVAQNRAKS